MKILVIATLLREILDACIWSIKWSLYCVVFAWQQYTAKLRSYKHIFYLLLKLDNILNISKEPRSFSVAFY